MKIIKCNRDGTDIEFTNNEIRILKNALNEVTNGIKIIDFEGEIGISREQSGLFLESIHRIIREKKESSHQNMIDSHIGESHNISNIQKHGNSILKEKITLKTEAYEVSFFLKNVDPSKSRVGLIILLNSDSDINKLWIKSTAQFVFVKDLQDFIKYLEKHIDSLKINKCANSSIFFLYSYKLFQAQALSSTLTSDNKESFPLHFMLRVDSQEGERSINNFIGAQAPVTLENIQSFILEMRAALDKIPYSS